MRIVKVSMIIVIAMMLSFLFLESRDGNDHNFVEGMYRNIKEKTTELEEKAMLEKGPPAKEELLQWIGKSSNKLAEIYGEPNRIDQSAYDYQWWVYNEDYDQYVQFGIEDEKIVTIFAAGKNMQVDPLSIGQSQEEVKKHFPFTDEITYQAGVSSYTFHITEEDMKTRPLVRWKNDVFIQLYFDSFTDTLSSIRIIDGETLLKHRPYEIVYRGNLPDEPDLSDEEWREVETGMERQILDLTNVYRNYHGISPLKLDEAVSEVAYLHSKDMGENEYFSHVSLNGDGLKERLAKNEVYYIAAGENIAAQYPDAIAAMEGWQNSKGHREALFSKEYTHIGIGVFRLYYTQNFLTKAAD